MGEQRVHRRLAAILAADVVGYSRLMRTRAPLADYVRAGVESSPLADWVCPSFRDTLFGVTSLREGS